MPTNKEAARVLAHPNGQRCELTQIHNHILLHAVRFGKVFLQDLCGDAGPCWGWPRWLPCLPPRCQPC